MIQQVDAIYENGVLRPLQPLHLKEAAKVQVLVSEDTSNSSSELIDQELLKYALARTNLLSVIPTLEEVRTKALANSRVDGGVDHCRHERFPYRTFPSNASYRLTSRLTMRSTVNLLSNICRPA